MLSDFERDGDLDVYLANDTNPNRLYENVPWPGGVAADPAGLGFRFEERAARRRRGRPARRAWAWRSATGTATAAPTSSSPTRAARATRLYRSNPPDANDPSFTDVRADAGIDLERSTGWGASWADLDHDTDLDLVLVNG